MAVPQNYPYINIHSHYKPRIPEEVVIRNGFAKVTKEFAYNVPYNISIGIHPWFITHDSYVKTIEMDHIANLPSVMAIGEIGLDRVIKTDIKIQATIFEQQLKLAEKLQKPVIIHCVRAYSDIIPFMKKYDLIYILHDYRGNLEQTRMLLKFNSYFSFGKSLFHTNFGENLKVIPLSRFFLETDNAPCTIDQVYNQAAMIRKISVEKIKEELFYTFASVFKKQPKEN